jgi:hypothetical protein
MGSEAAAEFASEFADADSTSNHQILRYVATIRDINVEHRIPTELEAETADTWLGVMLPSQYEHDEQST